MKARTTYTLVYIPPHAESGTDHQIGRELTVSEWRDFRLPKTSIFRNTKTGKLARILQNSVQPVTEAEFARVMQPPATQPRETIVRGANGWREKKNAISGAGLAVL